MNLRNAKVLLTMNLEGGHKPWFVKSSKTGKIRRIYNPDLNPNSPCTRVIHLSEDFVNHAISLEGRVSARMTYAFSNWKKFNQTQKLEANLSELVIALEGKTFTYEVIYAV